MELPFSVCALIAILDSIGIVSNIIIAKAWKTTNNFLSLYERIA